MTRYTDEIICCFIGHRTIRETEYIKARLYSEIERLIEYNGVSTFLFGSNSEFDSLCLKTVTDLQQKYPYIKRIYVRAEHPYIDNIYKNMLLKKYDDTYYPQKALNAGKAVYVKRNIEMIDNSHYCVFFYCNHYAVQKRVTIKHNTISFYQPKSGTAIAYNYAVDKGKNIINLFETE